MLQQIRIGLVRSLNAKLVDELLAAHVEAKRNYFLGGLRLSEVEGGRFCEAAFRLLQQMAFGAFDPLGTQLDTDGLIRKLAQIPTASKPDSVRLHIPRSLRVVYDIRNKRDAAHLADGIDPNLQDASLVVAVLDWVLAEFVRLHHSVSGNEAQNMVNLISTRMAPAIEDFGGFLKVLKTGLGASEHLLRSGMIDFLIVQSLDAVIKLASRVLFDLRAGTELISRAQLVPTELLSKFNPQPEAVL